MDVLATTSWLSSKLASQTPHAFIVSDLYFEVGGKTVDLLCRVQLLGQQGLNNMILYKCHQGQLPVGTGIAVSKPRER